MWYGGFFLLGLKRSCERSGGCQGLCFCVCNGAAKGVAVFRVCAFVFATELRKEWRYLGFAFFVFATEPRKEWRNIGFAFFVFATELRKEWRDLESVLLCLQHSCENSGRI